MFLLKFFLRPAKTFLIRCIRKYKINRDFPLGLLLDFIYSFNELSLSTFNVFIPGNLYFAWRGKTFLLPHISLPRMDDSIFQVTLPDIANEKSSKIKHLRTLPVLPTSSNISERS